jgi:branched-chain amino acid transport system permease protein
MNSLRRYGMPLTALVIFFLPIATSNKYYVHVATTVCVYVILVAGLDLVVGYAGNVSVGHAGLYAVGAYTAAILTTQHGTQFPLAVAAGILLTAGFGLLLGVPALRLSGPYLAMATIAFGFIINSIIKESVWLTNGTQGIRINHDLSYGRINFEDNNFFYLAYAIMLLSLLGVHRITTSYWGRAFEALKENPIAAESCGISRYRFRLSAFVLSAMLAGLAGALFIHVNKYIGPESFELKASILFLTALIFGGTRSILGNIIGALVVVALPDVFNNLFEYQLMIYGGLLLFTLYFMPDGIAGLLRRVLLHFFPPQRTATPTTDGAMTEKTLGKDGNTAGKPKASATGPITVHSSGAHSPSSDDNILLKTEGLTIAFGGLVAVNNLNLIVRRGEVHALIGPNGSGKSTTVNLLSGIYRPTAGKIRFAEQFLNHLAPHKIARVGIARTFQNPALFGDMTVLENVLVGLHPAFNGGLLHVLMMTRRARWEEQQSRTRAQALLDFVGLGHEAAIRARSLSYGRQRLLEIARALALSPSLLLLDEPAAGLTSGEIADIDGLIGKLRESGLSILLIEHHMDLVMAVSDEITVLDFGDTIAEGRPEVIQQNERVIAAYLGTTVNDFPAGSNPGRGRSGDC